MPKCKIQQQVLVCHGPQLEPQSITTLQLNNDNLTSQASSDSRAITLLLNFNQALFLSSTALCQSPEIATTTIIPPQHTTILNAL